MKNLIKWYYPLMILLFFSCSSDGGDSEIEPKPDPDEERFLNINSTAYRSNGESDFVLLRVISSGKWKAIIDEEAKSWIRVVPEEGTASEDGESVKVFLSRNVSEEDIRKSKVTFQLNDDDEVNKGFDVTQASLYKLQQDSIALVEVFHKLGGPEWIRPWDLTKPIKTWEAVYVEEVNGLQRVRSIAFENKVGVKGELPAEIGKLTALYGLNFYDEDQLTGSIPAEHWTNTELTMLWLVNCNLGGLLPKSLESIPTFVSLNIPGNNFTGVEEGWTGNFPNLVGFFINDNKFEGPLDRTLIKGMTKLLVCDLANNNFTGSVPENFFSGKADLMAFTMANNRLSGDFPDAIASGFAYSNSEPLKSVCPQQEGFGFTDGTCYNVSPIE